jgi:hypothetical protein
MMFSKINRDYLTSRELKVSPGTHSGGHKRKIHRVINNKVEMRQIELLHSVRVLISSQCNKAAGEHLKEGCRALSAFPSAAEFQDH